MLRCIMHNSFECRLITTEYVWIYLKRPRFINAYARKVSQLSKENRNSCNWYISIKIEAWGFKKYVYGVSFFSQCKCTVLCIFIGFAHTLHFVPFLILE